MPVLGDKYAAKGNVPALTLANYVTMPALIPKVMPITVGRVALVAPAVRSAARASVFALRVKRSAMGSALTF